MTKEKALNISGENILFSNLNMLIKISLSKSYLKKNDVGMKHSCTLGWCGGGEKNGMEAKIK